LRYTESVISSEMSGLAKYMTTRFTGRIARSLCDSWVSCF